MSKSIEEKIMELMEKNQELEAMYKSMENTVKEKDEQVKQLQEHNQKLFLKVTHKMEEPKHEEWYSTTFGEYTNLLSKEQIRILKSMEGEI